MDCVFGIQGKDFVIVAADGTVAYSIVKLNEAEDKIIELDEKKVLGLAGEGSDRNQFGQYIDKNLKLFKYRNGTDLMMKEAANFIRSEFAYGIRHGPYEVNALLGGVDKDGSPSLYWLDYMGSIQKVTRGAQGYGGYFLLGLLDNLYKKDLTLEEGLQIIAKCAQELKQRFLISQNKYIVKVVTKDGIQKHVI